MRHVSQAISSPVSQNDTKMARKEHLCHFDALGFLNFHERVHFLTKLSMKMPYIVMRSGKKPQKPVKNHFFPEKRKVGTFLASI